jgi:conjugative transfer signal peptidase TraF
MTIWPWRELRMLALVLGALACLDGAVQAIGLRWQHTESLPVGLYRVDPETVGARARIERGDVVVWCLDARRGRWARDRGYLTARPCPGNVERLGKMVLGVGGDTIDWTPAGVRLNGRPVPGTRPVLHDRAGRPMTPIAWGHYVLAPSTAWLYSPYSERSLDSRYFGPIPTTAIRARARLVWALHGLGPTRGAGTRR